MYVAVKGGEKAIDAAHALLARERRGDPALPALSVAQIAAQMGHAVARVMTEGALYDPDLAALALKQAAGDVVEAIFLIRAYRTTLPRLADTVPLDTGAMRIERRISASFKDLPGGQILGPTFDYTHRLLDFSLAAEEQARAGEPPAARSTGTEPPAPPPPPPPRVLDLLNAEGLIEPPPPDDPTRPVFDLTTTPPGFPAGRDQRLQTLARADEGWLLALGYSSQRGFGNTHPFAGEIRVGLVAVEVVPEEVGFAIDIGDILVTECEMVTQFSGSATQAPRFTRGYGLAFGRAERKAMAMALVDRALRARELGEEITAPVQDEEFVLSHGDTVESSGFVQHLKLPHYVDFQGELSLLRLLRREFEARRAAATATTTPPDEGGDHGA